MVAPWRSHNPVRITKYHITGKWFIIPKVPFAGVTCNFRCGIWYIARGRSDDIVSNKQTPKQGCWLFFTKFDHKYCWQLKKLFIWYENLLLDSGWMCFSLGVYLLSSNFSWSQLCRLPILRLRHFIFNVFVHFSVASFVVCAVFQSLIVVGWRIGSEF